MNKRYYEHTLPIIRGSLSNTYVKSSLLSPNNKAFRSRSLVISVLEINVSPTALTMLTQDSVQFPFDSCLILVWFLFDFCSISIHSPSDFRLISVHSPFDSGPILAWFLPTFQFNPVWLPSDSYLTSVWFPFNPCHNPVVFSVYLPLNSLFSPQFPPANTSPSPFLGKSPFPSLR